MLADVLAAAGVARANWNGKRNGSTLKVLINLARAYQTSIPFMIV